MCDIEKGTEMKYFLVGIMTLCLLAYTTEAIASRFVITGKPVILDPHPNYFTEPASYSPTPGYRFVSIYHVPRVCFLSFKSQFSSLDMVQINLEEQGEKLRWNCYQYTPSYFEIDF